MLIEACRTRGLSFVDDPSNRDPRFARTRMRDLTKTLSDGGMKTTDWARLAVRARRADDALAAATLQLAETLHVRRATDLTDCDARPLAGAPAELVLRLLMGEIARLGQAPRLERAEPLADLLQQRIATGSAFRATLGGTLIDLRPDGHLRIGRERPRQTRVKRAAGRDKTAEPHCDVHDDE
jgi:tRNA(Ile)-lysidine synthase